ncbi:MAG: PH domain-containing protein [Candidatus Gracilibacteria bacterium]|nr:PH domain-containing protein [Candidatus Gracilibacteria bacterium]MDD3120074.1 PH domain-containing protein [Candidatus Gracilibacteria bacterium]
MTITSQCFSCRKIFNLPEENLGKKAKCPFCGNIFVIDEFKKDLIKENKEFKKEIVQAQDNNRKINEDATVQNTKFEDVYIKPNKNSFIFLGNPLIISFLLLGIILVFIVPIVGIVFLILAGIAYGIRSIEYKKENYIIKDKVIIYSYGSIFSDNKIEIQMNKITQVDTLLGFIQRNIFKTGNLSIKTAAGGDMGKVCLKHISNTVELYEQLQKRMQYNGFSLKKEQLVQVAKPHFLGILGESTQIVFMNLFGIAYVLFSLGGSDIASLPGSQNIIIIIAVIVFIGLFIFFLLNYLDLKQRKYEVYDDSIFFTEGFLDHRYSFIPMENIADTENSQSFLSKVFGIHDVLISSEGSNNKILFYNMINGEKMMENIKYLKQHISLKKENNDIVQSHGIYNTDGNLVVNKKEFQLNYNKDFTGTYKINLLKNILATIPYLIFIIIFAFSSVLELLSILALPILIFFIVVQIIICKFTNFIVGNTTIERRFEFINTKHVSFSIDKITQVIFIESILDKILGTCSIKFLSIGSSSAICFSNIKKTDTLYQNILSKVGINKEGETNILPVVFSLMNFIKSNIFVVLFLIIIVLSIFIANFFVENIFLIPFAFFILLFPLISFVYKKFYFSERFNKQIIYTNFIESISGILIQTKQYALYENIKSIQVTKYPMTSVGTIKFFISGEQVLETSKKKSKYSQIVSNSTRIPYIDNCYELLDSMDSIINGQQINKEIISSRKQDLGNSMFYMVLSLLIVSSVIAPTMLFIPIIILPFIILYAFIIGIIIWYIKSKGYILEKSRIVEILGIVYKSKKSILYSKFNFIEQNQGFVNKIFKNGSVSIYTKGGSSSDMILSNIKDYVQIYDLLKR